jgi:LmbE family N-acetylglucosaminyl deacetylase
MKFSRLVWLILFLLLIPAAALGEPAEDISAGCSLMPSGAAGRAAYMLDDDYTTTWFLSDPTDAFIEVAAPEGQAIGGVYVKWNLRAASWHIDVLRDGEWKTVSQSADEYAVQYIQLPQGTERFRLYRSRDDTTEFRIAEMRVYGPGEPPADVQRWEPVLERCDIMVVSAHPDDEYLYMGGTIPYYIAQGKAVQVVYVAPSTSYRYLELLDGLWLCGERNYPVLGKFPDKRFDTVEELYNYWNLDALRQFLVLHIRMSKPDVIVTHDLRGEYGHVAHIATSHNTVWAAQNAADAAVDPDSAALYGTWQVKKLYLHLYSKNRLYMDWSKPLAYIGGETALSVAQRAFAMHRSQQLLNYRVLDSGDYDCRLFGLYFSIVGEDIMKNDFLENIP